jgi:putative transcriptional regulator
MKRTLAPYNHKQAMKDLNELDKWLKGQPSAFRKVPVEPVSKSEVLKARKAVHLTREKFATLLGVNPVTVRYWENGQRNPDGLARKVLRLLTKRPELAKDFARV